MSKIACEKCFKEYKDLEKRNCVCGGIIKPLRAKRDDTYWNNKNLSETFIRFYKENGHYPSAHEVDKCPYMPAARSIQRRFGGLVGFREKYNLGEKDLSRGEYRSNLARKLNVISKENEKNFFDKLKGEFGEICVHREKPMSDDYKIRYDFYVYVKPKNFGIDVFYPNGIKNLMGCINIKQEKLKYLKVQEPIYIVCLNPDIQQQEINKLIQNKINKLSNNIVVITENTFFQRLEQALTNQSLKKYSVS